MGEVFRARDTRLHRDVAVKVLPNEFATDAERLRRFQQEATSLAALNHPNVLTIHDAGVHESVPYLVSELLEGQTLREVLGGSQHTGLPARRALDYALQIAHGLAAAHGKGIIHRDLKPDNIFVTKDGRLKVLDFGLAKLHDPSLRLPSPTSSQDATQPGRVLGTPNYMAPEQVRGEPVDHRADIFAFGCVLYEMVSGRRPFKEETAIATMAAILNKEVPDLMATKPDLPPAVGRIIHRCLEKQPERRFHSAHDLAFAIESAGAVSTSTQLPLSAVGRPNWQRALPWAIAVLSLILMLGAIGYAWRAGAGANSPGLSSRPGPPPPLRKLEIRLPLPTRKGASAALEGLALSPDGRKIAYANADGVWLRSLDRLGAPVLLAASDKASSPFWSPDSTDIAWFEGASLMRVPVTGGRPVTICRISLATEANSVEGGAWLENGEIIFSTGTSGLYRVLAQGGNAELALVPDPGEVDFHDASSWPDRRGVVFVVHRTEGLGITDTIATWTPKDGAGGRKTLFQRSGSRLANPVVSSSGHVIFIDRNAEGQENQWAIPISLRTRERTGEPFRLTEGGGRPSVSADGSLLLDRHDSASIIFDPRQLVWVDRSGRISSPLSPAHKGMGSPRLSPDERSVVFSAGERLVALRIWILDLTRGSALPLQGSGGAERGPFWLPSGREIALTGLASNSVQSLIRPLEGNRPSDTIGPGILSHLSRSGQYAFLSDYGGDGTNGYLRLTAQEPAKLILLPKTLSDLEDRWLLRPSLSPDDKTLAFQSDESGRNEIYAVAFPGFTNRVPVSRGGGRHPWWSPDGSALYYLSLDGLAMMAVSVEHQNGRQQFGEAVKLFDVPESICVNMRAGRTMTLFDVSTNGQRFLMMQKVKHTQAPNSEPTVLLIQNWFEEFRPGERPGPARPHYSE